MVWYHTKPLVWYSAKKSKEATCQSQTTAAAKKPSTKGSEMYLSRNFGNTDSESIRTARARTTALWYFGCFLPFLFLFFFVFFSTTKALAILDLYIVLNLLSFLDMIIMIKHGLRLRKKDDLESNQESEEDATRENKSRHVRSTASSPVLLLLAVLGVIAVAAVLQSKGPWKESDRLSRPESMDTLEFADGLIQLHIPGLDKRTKTLVAPHHGPWTLQACFVKHGTKCPDSPHFPLHVQIRQGPYIHAARWEAADATPLCGGGKAWQMTLPHQQSSNSATAFDSMMMIELNWFQSACLHGYKVEPWTATVELTVERRTEESVPLLQKVDDDPLFVTQAAWRTTQGLSSGGVALPPYLFTPIVSAHGLPDLAKRLTTEGAFVLPDAVVKPDPGYGKVRMRRKESLGLCRYSSLTLQFIISVLRTVL